MDIILDTLLPHAFGDKQLESGVWGKKITFKKGTIVHIKAPSARGKTTLISILYGLRHDFNGTIHFDTTTTSALSPDEWARYRRESLSIVFQDLRLFDNLTGLENILIKAELTPMTGKRTRPLGVDRIREMAAMCNVVDGLDKKAACLSRGEKQRIAIIRALAQPFDWLFMDEPFSHLDRENRNKVIECISERKEEEQGSILITNLEKDTFFSYEQKVSI